MTNIRIGIRREDKNEWERRVPLVPADVEELVRREDLSFVVQPSERRAFPDADFEKAGARLGEDLSACRLVLGVKEMPASFFREGGAYAFFAHVIKGQAGNMPMLAALLDKRCSLVDYEKITDEAGRRLVFFGRHAGLAGMIDTLWALGDRLRRQGTRTPFAALEPAHAYADLDAAKDAVREAGEAIRRDGLPEALCPLVCAFAGYGHVSRGAQEIFDLLPVETIDPGAVPQLGNGSPRKVYKAVYREEHLVAPRDAGASFALQDYYDHPERYHPVFEKHLPRLTLVINAVYWEERYPRLITRKALEDLFAKGETPRLQVIGDISCDVRGACEATVCAATPGEPVYVYDPRADETVPGTAGPGPAVLAVDNLPAELPVEASRDFSGVLRDFVPPLARADYASERPDLPGPLRRALIVRHGALTPDFAYLRKHL